MRRRTNGSEELGDRDRDVRRRISGRGELKTEKLGKGQVEVRS